MKQAWRVIGIVSVLALFVTLCGCGGGNLTKASGVNLAAKGGGGGTPPPSPATSRIVFQQKVRVRKPSHYQVLVRTMNPDGTGVASLAPGYEAAWSPDGTRIAYCGPCQAPGGTTTECIYTMNADGSSQQQVTEPVQSQSGISDDTMPDWSPDGTKIVFSRGFAGGYLSIHVVDVATHEVTPLTQPSPSTYRDCFWPTWSPDGTWIAFHAAPAGQTTPDIMVMSAQDGTGLKTVFSGATLPAWSADGEQMAFVRWSGGYGLWRASWSSDTGELVGTLVQLTTSMDEGWPTWSPDGTEIAFTHFDGGSGAWQICKVKAADGTGWTCLISDNGYGPLVPDWSPTRSGGS